MNMLFRFVAALCCTVAVVAQPITVSVSVRNPAPQALETWRTDPTIVQITLTNTGTTSRDVVIGIELRNRTTGQTVTTNNNHPCMPVIQLAANQTRVLRGPDFICQNAVNLDESTRTSIITAGALPEGDYQFCVTVLDARDRRTQLATTGSRCAVTQVLWPDPPVLVRPLQSDSAQRCDNTILLQWQPLVPNPAGTIQYRVRAVGMFEGQDPRQALQSATLREIIVDEITRTTSYTIPPNNSRLLDLVQRRSPRTVSIAWQVQAQYTSGAPVPTRGGTEGKSDIGVFTVECPGASTTSSCSGPMTLNGYYPLQNDTIPWLPPHLVVQWGPFCNQVSRVNLTVNVSTSDGRTVGSNTRTLYWGERGPIYGQGLSRVSNAEERARLLYTNQITDDGSFVSWNNEFRRGGTYRWRVNATITRLEGRSEQTYPVSTEENTFTLGLRMPTEPSPAVNERLSSGRDLTLAWTIPPPRQLVPPDIVSSIGRDHSFQMFGSAAEFVRVVVARDPEFRTIVASHRFTMPTSGNYTTGDPAASELFGRKTWSGLNLPDGTYYWRVEYASPSDTANPYRRGPVWNFTIGSSVSPSACIRIRPHQPDHRSTVTSPADGRIQFSITVEPQIRLEAVTACRVRIWQMSRPDENPEVVRSRDPILTAGVTRAEGSIPLRLLGSSGSTQTFALDLINTAGSRFSFTANNGQTYFWVCELNFEGDRIRSDGTRCDAISATSEGIFTFRVSQCNDPCEAPAPSNTTPLATALNPGDVIRIGHFEAELTRVEGTDNQNLRGEALVRIPWFGLRVRTTFNGIAVNTSRQVYSGELRAVQASGSGLSADVANQLSGGLELTNEQINAIDEFITAGNRFVSMLTGQPVTLPIGFDRTIDGFRAAFGIIGMVFTPRNAHFNAVISVPLPWLEGLFGERQSLGLGVRNVCFSPNGLGRSLDIYLANDLGYRHRGSGEGDSWAIRLKAPPEGSSNQGTYVRISCAGFEYVNIDAEVEFPRSWMVPSPDDGRNVALRFTTQVRSNGGFLASCSITPFSPVGASGFVFTCNQVAVDFSDRANPEGIVFPTGFSGETSERWQGFYLRNLSMQFPEAIRGFGSTGPPRVDVRNMLIDRSGLTLDLLATNIFQYPRANFGDWGASIDTFHLRIVNNEARGFRMSGQIKLPISDTPLDYSAHMGDRSGGEMGSAFVFTISPRGTLNIPLWVATMQLDRTSSIQLRDTLIEDRRRFIAEANLSGTISLGGTEHIPMRMGGIGFQNMRIQTHARPYISVGSWSFASPPHSILGPPEPEPVPDGGGSNSRSAGGFPVTIRNVSIVSGDRSGSPGVGVRFELDVNLQGGERGISGRTSISVWGALSTESGRPPSFGFSGIELDEIGVRANLGGAVEIEGLVQFYNNDRTYGNGFRGAVRANFVRMLTVDATVQFGSKDSTTPYRYWYVDARAIPYRPFPIGSAAIYGFGGGAWYNMRRASDPSGVTPTSAEGTTTTASSGNPGTTNSGARYEPYYSSGGETFGFYALVTLGTHPEPKAFNCDVRLEVSFVGGGINEIRLEGNGWMMAGFTERSNAPVTMRAVISYTTSPAPTFNGNFDIVAAYPRSSPIISARGHMVIHFSPSRWFVKIGDPDPNQRVEVNVANLAIIRAYFAAGTDLPAPQLPREVSELLSSRPIQRPVEVQRGNGIVLGASFERSAPNLQCLFFYASFRFLVGFDLALLNDSGAQCGSTRPIGLNGWYATGQLYARVDGSVGLEADLGFIRGKFEILDIHLAAMLQGGLPNPTWLAGAVGGQYSILNGLIRGNCNFQFTIGERCIPPRESAIASVEMISDIVPDDGSTDVSIFAEPTAFFNIAPEQPFTLEEMLDNGETRPVTFRIMVGSFTLQKRTSSGVFVDVQVSRPTVRRDLSAPAATITPNEPLESVTVYKATVMAYAQRYYPGIRFPNGQYIPARWEDVHYQTGRQQGQRVEQKVSTQFTTQPRPDTVVPDWVYIAYPRPMQRFFLQDECRDGSITLLTNPEYLFPSSGSRRRVVPFNQYFLVRFINLSTLERVEVPLEYRRITRPYYVGERRERATQYGGQIRFTIPRLANETIYAVQVIRQDERVDISGQSVNVASLRNSTLSSSAPRQNTSNSSNSGVTLASNVIQGQLTGTVRSTLYQQGENTVTVNRQYRPSGFDVARVVGSNEKLLYLYFFRTSRYNRMANKVREVQTVRADSVVALFVTGISTELSSPEGFDPADLQTQEVNLSYDGTERTTHPYRIPPLIQISALRRVDRWHGAYVNPLYDEIQWIHDLARSKRVQLQETWWNEQFRQGNLMFEARPSHQQLQDYEIAAAPGGNTMARWFSWFFARFERITYQNGTWTFIPRSGNTQQVTRGFYAQPSYVSLDYLRARDAAARLLSRNDLGDRDRVRLDLFAPIRRFIFPFKKSMYTIDFRYIGCPYDPDLGPPTVQYQFQY